MGMKLAEPISVVPSLNFEGLKAFENLSPEGIKLAELKPSICRTQTPLGPLITRVQYLVY
jgi:hypothetical protein